MYVPLFFVLCSKQHRDFFFSGGVSLMWHDAQTWGTGTGTGNASAHMKTRGEKRKREKETPRQRADICMLTLAARRYRRKPTSSGSRNSRALGGTGDRVHTYKDRTASMCQERKGLVRSMHTSISYAAPIQDQFYPPPCASNLILVLTLGRRKAG